MAGTLIGWRAPLWLSCVRQTGSGPQKPEAELAWRRHRGALSTCRSPHRRGLRGRSFASQMSDDRFSNYGQYAQQYLQPEPDASAYQELQYAPTTMINPAFAQPFQHGGYYMQSAPPHALGATYGSIPPPHPAYNPGMVLIQTHPLAAGVMSTIPPTAMAPIPPYGVSMPAAAADFSVHPTQLVSQPIPNNRQTWASQPWSASAADCGPSESSHTDDSPTQELGHSSHDDADRLPDPSVASIAIEESSRSNSRADSGPGVLARNVRDEAAHPSNASDDDNDDDVKDKVDDNPTVNSKPGASALADANDDDDDVEDLPPEDVAASMAASAINSALTSMPIDPASALSDSDPDDDIPLQEMSKRLLKAAQPAKPGASTMKREEAQALAQASASTLPSPRPSRKGKEKGIATARAMATGAVPIVYPACPPPALRGHTVAASHKPAAAVKLLTAKNVTSGDAEEDEDDDGDDEAHISGAAVEVRAPETAREVVLTALAAGMSECQAIVNHALKVSRFTGGGSGGAYKALRDHITRLARVGVLVQQHRDGTYALTAAGRDAAAGVATAATPFPSAHAPSPASPVPSRKAQAPPDALLQTNGLLGLAERFLVRWPTGNETWEPRRRLPKALLEEGEDEARAAFNRTVDPTLPNAPGVVTSNCVRFRNAKDCAEYLKQHWTDGKLPLGETLCHGYASYAKVLEEHDEVQQRTHTLLMTNALLPLVRKYVPGFREMEESLVQWLNERFSTVVELFFAHGLRQSSATLKSTGFDVHQDTEDYDFIEYTVVVKLSADEPKEPPSAMRVVGAHEHFYYGKEAGAAGCFLARLYHASCPPESPNEHLKVRAQGVQPSTCLIAHHASVFEFSCGTDRLLLPQERPGRPPRQARPRAECRGTRGRARAGTPPPRRRGRDQRAAPRLRREPGVT